MEQSFVAWAKMRARRLPQVKIGIGDDAAVLQADGRDMVVTSDTLMDGVHFLLKEADAREVGRKAAKVNLSDIAAMGAEPSELLLSMCLPTSHDQAADWLASEIYEGFCEAAEQYSVALAGGDTNCWDGPLVLSVTAMGRVTDDQLWTRSGALPDDRIIVTGPLGGSILEKHFRFEPRFDVVKAIHQAGIDVHAAMDISDGLSVDLLRMCDASRCGAILELDKVPISEAAKHCAKTSSKTAVEHALGDGEDFELLLAVAPSQIEALRDCLGKTSVFDCGEFSSRTGLWAKDGGKIRQLTSSGYVHGR